MRLSPQTVSQAVVTHDAGSQDMQTGLNSSVVSGQLNIKVPHVSSTDKTCLISVQSNAAPFFYLFIYFSRCSTFGGESGFSCIELV